MVRLAAAECRRVLQRLSASGALPSVSDRSAVGAVDEMVEVLAAEAAPGAPDRDAFSIEATPSGVRVHGATPRAALYGAYRFAMMLGVRFSLAGEAVPTPASAAFDLDSVRLSSGLPLPFAATPDFETRGLQPFHDFQSGPDAWDVDEYGRVAELMTKQGGNFWGFHTYPLREPLVWVGLEGQFETGTGAVAWSYNTSWATTEETLWGYTPVPTSDYGFGADRIFAHDCSGSVVNEEPTPICPFPDGPAQNNAIFDRAGALLSGAIRFARSLGVETTVGTEAPLAKPPQPAAANGSLVPLWLYTSPTRGDSFATTTLCGECEGLYGFAGPVAMVWNSQPPASRGASVPLATWYSGERHDNWLTTSSTEAPAPGYGFVRVEGWAMVAPGDPAAGTTPLTTWVRGNDHRTVTPGESAANATAGGYTQAATLGHVMPIAGTVTPSSVTPSTEDFYRGIFSRLEAVGAAPDGYWVATPEGWEWDKVNMSDPVVADVVADMLAANRARDAVAPGMSLATYGWVLGPLGNRSYLDGVLPPDWTMTSIDQKVGWAPVDPSYANVTHHRKYVIPWAEDDPRLTQPQLWVNRSIEHGDDAQRYGAEGLINIHWRTRAVAPQVAATARRAWAGNFTSAEFWQDWAAAEFGPGVGPRAADVFGSVDSFAAPMPVAWISGPGGMKADPTQCAAAASDYLFVDRMCALRPSVLADVEAGLADEDALERFEYWCSAFRYWRLLAETECAWAQYDAVIAAVALQPDAAKRIAMARKEGFAARAAVVSNVTSLMARQLETASTVGERGITSNLRSRSLNKALFDLSAQLMDLANVTALPEPCRAPTAYGGEPRLRVPSPRGILTSGDDLRVSAWALLPPGHEAAGASPVLRWRKYGSGGAFANITMTRQAADRDVWRGRVAAVTEDIEWTVSLGTSLIFPAAGVTRPFVTLTHA